MKLSTETRRAKGELMRLATRMQADSIRGVQEGKSIQTAIGAEASESLEMYELPKDFRLSVVMPVFNERETVASVISRVFETWLPIELIVVNDGSTDGTSESLDRLADEMDPTQWHPNSTIQMIHQPTNQGKGAALREAFKVVSGDLVVIQDADKEYDPNDFYSLMRPILEDDVDVVYGSRFQSESKSSSPGWHRFGNRSITWISNLKTRQRFTDVETCYKMFRRSLLEKIGPTLREKRFGIELEMTAKLSRIKGVRFRELPITYEKRGYADGKKIGWKDGLWALWCILRY